MIVEMAEDLLYIFDAGTLRHSKDKLAIELGRVTI